MKSMIAIVDYGMGNIRSVEKGFLKVGAEARELMIRTGYSPAFGARVLRRAVERLLQVPLSQLVLNGELAKHEEWRAERKGLELVFEPA